MKKPINAIKPDISKMTRRELRSYLSVLSTPAAHNASLKALVKSGELVISEEIAAINAMLGED